MLIIFVIWCAIGVIGQIIFGGWAACKLEQFNEKNGEDYSLYMLWSESVMYGIRDFNPFMPAIIDSVDHDNVVLYLLSAILGNLFGYITWPVYIPKLAGGLKKTLAEYEEKHLKSQLAKTLDES